MRPTHFFSPSSVEMTASPQWIFRRHAVGKKGDVFFQMKCSAFTPSNFYDRSSICRKFGVPVPPSRKQVEGCGQGTPRKRRGAGLSMGDDGRDGDEASHGTLSLSPPGTRVIGSDRRSGCCGDRKGGQNARKVYIGQAGQIADVAVVRARRLTSFSTGSRLARKTGKGESLHMYELHAHSTHTPRKRRHRAAARI